MLLEDLSPNSQIIFTDQPSCISHLENNSSSFNIDFNKLEGLLLFQPNKYLTKGTEIEWIKGKDNLFFEEYGNFYLSSLSDEIVIVMMSSFPKPLFGFAYGNSATTGLIESLLDPNITVLLPNILDCAKFVNPNNEIDTCLYTELSNEENWYILNSNSGPKSIPKYENRVNSIESPTNTLKIMPLGDSVTRGKNKINSPSDFVGYRRPLFQLLDSAGYNIDIEVFLGSIDYDTLFSDFDSDHEGHGGYQIFIENRYGGIWRDLYHNLDGGFGGENWLGINSPDYIFLHIGTNDIGQGENPDSLIKQLSNVVNRIFSVNSSMKLFLAKIINVDSTLSSNWNNTSEYNIKIDDFVSHSPYRDNIIVLDMESALDYDFDLIDDVHPNDIGYKKMAVKWFNKLQEYYSPHLDYPSNNDSISLDGLTLSWHSNTTSNTKYILQVSTDSLFTNLITDTSNLITPNYALNNISCGLKYYWRVRSENFSGLSNWSSVNSFTTYPFYLSLNVLLEGAYLSEGIQLTTLQNNSLLPHMQPFNTPPWNYLGDEFYDGNDTNVVDWILVSLGKSTNYSDRVYSKAVLLTDNGVISDNRTDFIEIENIPAGEYYLFIEHRNHLKIISSSKVIFN